MPRACPDQMVVWMVSKLEAVEKKGAKVKSAQQPGLVGAEVNKRKKRQTEAHGAALTI